MRFISGEEISTLLTMDDCIAAVEDAFRAYGERRLVPPQSLGVHAARGTFHLKTAIGDLFAAKINANFPTNLERGLPTIQGVIVLMSVDDGTPLAILDSAVITTMRTAAATAVAARYLARRDARTLAIIGCGTQGHAHVEALRLENVYAYDTDPARAERFARATGAVVAPTIDDAVANADIIVTCTPSRTPILDAHHLHRGLFIAAVGADNPEKHELAPELMREAIVVADILEQSATMGDLHHAIAAGVMTRADVHGELADIICGRVRGRGNEDEVFVFDSTGTALQDLAVAAIAYARAV